MDWDGVIDKNRAALKRILASLVAMAGLGALEQSWKNRAERRDTS